MKYLMYAFAAAITCIITEFIIFPFFFDNYTNALTRILVNTIFVVLAILFVETIYKRRNY